MSCTKSRAVSRDRHAATASPVAVGRFSPSTLASDADRERTVAHLRTAHGEGRLEYAELEQRAAAAYQARTYGDLAPLTADLPAAAPLPVPARRRGNGTRIALAASWSAWAAAVAVNVLIWALVSLGADEAVYFWPIWVAGPWGAVLAVTSVATMLATRAPRD